MLTDICTRPVGGSTKRERKEEVKQTAHSPIRARSTSQTTSRDFQSASHVFDRGRWLPGGPKNVLCQASVGISGIEQTYELTSHGICKMGLVKVAQCSRWRRWSVYDGW